LCATGDLCQIQLQTSLPEFVHNRVPTMVLDCQQVLVAERWLSSERETSVDITSTESFFHCASGDRCSTVVHVISVNVISSPSAITSYWRDVTRQQPFCDFATHCLFLIAYASWIFTVTNSEKSCTSVKPTGATTCWLTCILPDVYVQSVIRCVIVPQ